jgi:hypothetical protein
MLIWYGDFFIRSFGKRFDAVEGFKEINYLPLPKSTESTQLQFFSFSREERNGITAKGGSTLLA